MSLSAPHWTVAIYVSVVSIFIVSDLVNMIFSHPCICHVDLSDGVRHEENDIILKSKNTDGSFQMLIDL